MQLSKEQKSAATTDSKKAMLIAGAGSGKSRTLVGRAKHLIENKGVSPYEIMCITFTRLAAKEMITRLEKEIGPQAFKITASTIHGMALKFLQTYGEIVGLRPDKITVYGTFEEQFLLKDVAKEIGFHDGHKWKKVKKGTIDHVFNTYYTTGGLIIDEYPKENILLNAFLVRCKENNALTYGTILTTFKRLIPEIAQYLNLRHILIDETQDNDPLQWSIVNDLCDCCGSDLFAVGDMRQAIFGFRGGDAEYINRNQHLFDVYNLRDNYRSSANIVEAANKLIAHNPMDLGEPMRAKKDYNGPVKEYKNMDSSAILESLKLAHAGFLKQTAVLARNHYLLKKLSRLLNDAGIKHEYIGKKSGLVRSEEFRRFHSFLKLIVNVHDNFSFLLIKDYLGISNEEYGEIRIMAVEQARSHYQIFREVSIECMWMDSAGIEDFDATIDWMKDIDFGFDTDSIFDFVYAWIIDNPAGTIEQYLVWLATFDISDEIKDESEGLQLQTIHSAKGLEFDTVIIIGLNEGVFPDSRSVKENNLVDETRLMYVAISRGIDQVILTSRPTKDKYGKENPVSRFIKWSLS